MQPPLLLIGLQSRRLSTAAFNGPNRKTANSTGQATELKMIKPCETCAIKSHTLNLEDCPRVHSRLDALGQRDAWQTKTEENLRENMELPKKELPLVTSLAILGNNRVLCRLHSLWGTTHFLGESSHTWYLYDHELEASCMGLCVGARLAVLISFLCK